MKKLMILLALCLGTACRQDNDESSIRSWSLTTDTGGVIVGGGKKSEPFYHFNQSGYMGQLPYIVSDCPSEISAFNASREIAVPLSDSAITWQHFDALYDNDQTPAIKQDLAIFTLRNKGLIEAARQEPKNPVYQATLVKHINSLVATQYFGYSLLHAALQQCSDTGYVKRKAAQIMAYAVTETFHQTYLNDPSLSYDWRYQKVEEDLACLAKIRDLTD